MDKDAVEAVRVPLGKGLEPLAAKLDYASPGLDMQRPKGCVANVAIVGIPQTIPGPVAGFLVLVGHVSLPSQ